MSKKYNQNSLIINQMIIVNRTDICQKLVVYIPAQVPSTRQTRRSHASASDTLAVRHSRHLLSGPYLSESWEYINIQTVIQNWQISNFLTLYIATRVNKGLKMVFIILKTSSKHNLKELKTKKKFSEMLKFLTVTGQNTYKLK